MPVAIHCRDLRKTYDGKLEAVRGLNLEIQTGECFGLLGPNGAGKTTTIEILEGLLEPTSGEVSILGHSWQQERARDARVARHLPAGDAPVGKTNRARNHRTIRQLLPPAALVRRSPRATATHREGRRLGRQAVRRTAPTPRRRDGAGRAIPKILFLDEPTTGLDPQSRRQLWDIIRAFQRDGGTVLLTTHYMDEAERLCDRLAVVDHGQIIAEGSPADLIERLGGHHVVEFSVSGGSDGATLQAWNGLPSVESVREDDGLIALNVKQPHLTIPALLEAIDQRGSHLQHLTTRQASLEDVFVRLTGRHLREE